MIKNNLNLQFIEIITFLQKGNCKQKLLNQKTEDHTKIKKFSKNNLKIVLIMLIISIS
jgi:hypothetical protein